MQDILEDAFVLGNLGRIGPLFCMDLALKKKKKPLRTFMKKLMSFFELVSDWLISLSNS